MPPVEIELEIPYNIQIAALLSLGLVYVKSANKHISYVLLKEIGRLPGNEIDKDVHSLDREAYSLTAGLALGMILLEKGKKSLTIMDSTFTDELYHYMVGGHKEKVFDAAATHNQYNSSAIPNANATNGAQSSNNSNTNPANSESNFPGSISSSNFRNPQSSYIREGESINTNVTCPGATLALGLIYFNSCDKLIGEWFSPPDSAFLLDSIRPDFLLLRTVARNLIMWKYILPSQTWLISQLSNILKSNLKSDNVLSKKFAHLVSQAGESQKAAPKPPVVKEKLSAKLGKAKKLVKSAIIEENESDESDEADSSDASTINELNANTDDDDNVLIHNTKKAPRPAKKKLAKHLLSDLIQFDDVDGDDLWFEEDSDASLAKKLYAKDVEEEYDEITNADLNSDESSTHSANMIDCDTKTEAFRHIVAGACMSMGLKFAGTFNNEAYETLVIR